MDLLSYCASGKYSKKRSLKSAIALRNKEAGEHNIDRKPLELPQFYKALCHHHPSSKHQPHLLYFDKGDIIKVLEKGDSMWRGCKKDPPPTEPPSDAPCAKQNATTRREDGSLKTPEPMLATSNSVSGWFPSDNLCLTKDLKVTHDKQLSNDDTVSIIDVPPAMTEFKHSRYDTSEVIKRPQNDLCKDSDRDSGISPQHLQQFYSQQMFGILMNAHVASSAWKHWTDHIIKFGSRYDIKKASLVYCKTGLTASTSHSKFNFSTQEMQMLGSYFDGEVFNQVTLQGKTFVKKSKVKDEIIVFNGRTYYIITRSKTMFIIVKCESKNKHPEAAKWVHRISEALIAKGY